MKNIKKWNQISMQIRRRRALLLASAIGTVTSKIIVTPKGATLSEKLQLIAALCNEIWPQ